MRVLMRERLQIDNGVNLEALTPLQKVQAGLLSVWHNSSRYKRLKNVREGARLKEQLEKDAVVRQHILTELITRFELKKEKEPMVVIIKVDFEYKDSLFRVLGLDKDGEKDPNSAPSKAFSEFDIALVPEHPDLRVAFEDMPLLLRCYKRKALEGVAE